MRPEPLQQLSQRGVGYNGGSTFTITPPAASRGTYTLTATGNTRGLKATSILTVGPGILISPTPAIPGSTITVSGGGFTAGDMVNVYFQKTSNGVVNATVDATGNFTANLILPFIYNPGLKYFVYAKSSTGSDKASTPVTFVTPSVQFFITVNTYGQQVYLTGQGFAANESVNLYWNYKQVGQILAATSTAGIDGTVSFSFTMPSDPSLHGGGFGSLEKVTVSFNGITIATPTTNVSGAFSVKYVVPSSTKTGLYTIAAQGSLSGVVANAKFTVPPHVSISPTTGTTGTLVTVTGTSFSPSGNITINWVDPNLGGLTYLTSVIASSNGKFTTTVTIPANIFSGRTYLIEVFDPTGAIGQASFTSQ